MTGDATLYYFFLIHCDSYRKLRYKIQILNIVEVININMQSYRHMNQSD